MMDKPQYCSQTARELSPKGTGLPVDPSYAHQIAVGLAAESDHASVFAFMERRAISLDSRFISVGQLPEDGKSSVSILCPRGPQDYFRHYVARRYDRVSPVVARMRANMLPFMWSEVNDDRLANPLGHQCMSEAREAGLVDAFCVPIGSSTGILKGWVTFFTDRIGDFDLRAKSALQFIALTGLDRLMSLDSISSAAQGALTPTEKEVLAGVHAGKASDAIAGLLGISVRTVDHHISAAAAKLGTASRVQTALEAMRTGQLQGRS